MSFLTEGASPRDAVYVAVIGPGRSRATPADAEIAWQIGRLLAARDAIVVCGGLDGVMEAVCEGAASSRGLTVGLLPGDDRATGNEHLAVALPTGMGELRNGLVVGVCDVVIAIGKSWGTLSEIGMAARGKKPVIMIGGWAIEDLADQQEAKLFPATSAEEAVALALHQAAIGKACGPA